MYLKRIKPLCNTDKMEFIKMRGNITWEKIFGIKQGNELILNI